MGLFNIGLSAYSDEYIDSLTDYMLPKEQYQFTSYPIEILEKSQLNQDMFPVLIINHKKEAVGFFCLNSGKRVTEVTNNQRALLLTSFSINYKYQKRGYAKQALCTISNFIKDYYADINEIVLVVNVKNIPAQSLYKKCGFMDLGERRTGPKGEQMVLHLEI